MFDKDIDRQRMLFVFLEDHERLLEQAMVNRNLGNFLDIVVFRLIDIVNDLAFVCTDSGQHEQILEVTVLAEW